MFYRNLPIHGNLLAEISDLLDSVNSNRPHPTLIDEYELCAARCFSPAAGYGGCKTSPLISGLRVWHPNVIFAVVVSLVPLMFGASAMLCVDNARFSCPYDNKRISVSP